MKKNYLWTAVKAALLVPTVGMTITAANAQTAPAADDNVEVTYEDQIEAQFVRIRIFDRILN